MTREEAIKLIGSMKGDLCDFYDDNDLTALEMAIASLKTDETYQLEYENRNFVEIPEGMTNGEVIQALFDGLVIDDNSTMRRYAILMTYEFWNAPYKAKR